jgi:hypothetical protein
VYGVVEFTSQVCRKVFETVAIKDVTLKKKYINLKDNE